MFEHQAPPGSEMNENVPLEKQLDILPWSELARHFAFGRLYVVREPWNLLDAARIIRADDAPRLKAAMESSEFGPPTEEEALLWHQGKQSFEVLILDPFVLIAPAKTEA